MTRAPTTKSVTLQSLLAPPTQSNSAVLTRIASDPHIPFLCPAGTDVVVFYSDLQFLWIPNSHDSITPILRFDLATWITQALN